MVQFEKIPLTRRYIAKVIKFGLKYPKEAFLNAIFGIGRYQTLREYKIAKTKFVPTNPVEEKMNSYSDTWQHIPTLYLLCLLKKPQVILELGVRTGNTTVPLLYAAKQYGGHVYSVDVEVWPELESNVNNDLKDSWTFIVKNDLELKWDLPIDLLYIDTTHYYDHTLNELKKYEPYVKSGGMILFHDIFMDEVSTAISHYFKDRRDITYVRYFNNNGLGIIFKN